MVCAEVSIVVPCYNEADNVAPLVTAVSAALKDRSWEVIFVDDNSPDGTINVVRRLAQQDERVRGLLRIGRKGLSSAVIEGILASSAPIVAVMDGDLQHDEACLPAMLDAIQNEQYDVAVASRHVEGGDSAGLSNKWRHFLSEQGIRLAKSLSVPVNDPMSGFFAVRREWFETVAPNLTGRGFKILMEMLLAAPKPVKVKEVPMVFRDRLHGESKLGPQVMIQFLIMIVEGLYKKPAVKRATFVTGGSIAGLLALFCIKRRLR
ncbi:polyprenol monophosphomannose synthase [Acetobacter cibinongensis]|uniref:polyprenol monophosphomannose synthase n=1 Tax=Acetobacter cibinongensis TaxID=146475 RepID=UPI000A36EB91|nr:polyprenol monophosphomannose synthase [Acetobacter cibinongensis]